MSSYVRPCYKRSGHANPDTCLCHECYETGKVVSLKFRQPDHPDFREPHPKYPDCLDCYMYYHPMLKEELFHHCGEHVPAPKVDSRKAVVGTEFAFTLTMPPTYTPKKPIEEAARLLLENGLTNKPYEKASEWAFVVEHTEQGTPHVHGVYKTPSGRRIASKYFQRYWPLWDEKKKLGQGHQGGYMAVARHSESYSAYLEKEGVVIKSTPIL